MLPGDKSVLKATRSSSIAGQTANPNGRFNRVSLSLAIFVNILEYCFRTPLQVPQSIPLQFFLKRQTSGQGGGRKLHQGSGKLSQIGHNLRKRARLVCQ